MAATEHRLGKLHLVLLGKLACCVLARTRVMVGRIEQHERVAGRLQPLHDLDRVGPEHPRALQRRRTFAEIRGIDAGELIRGEATASDGLRLGRAEDLH